MEESKQTQCPRPDTDFTERCALSLNQDGESYTVSEVRPSFNVTEIPPEYNGKPITSIGNNATGVLPKLKILILPETIREIREWAFCDCIDLSSINLPKGIRAIGEWAFFNCSSLETVTIPEGTSGVGAWAFGNCFSLTDIYILGKNTYIGHKSIPENTVIHGYPDSFAEIYAAKMGNPFVAITDLSEE